MAGIWNELQKTKFLCNVDIKKKCYMNNTIFGADMWKEKDVVGFTVLNDEKARWSQVKIIYNARKNSYYKEELFDTWT